jgi:hypothetical protein
MAIYGEVSKILAGLVGLSSGPPATRSSSVPPSSVSPAEVSIPLSIMTASLRVLGDYSGNDKESQVTLEERLQIGSGEGCQLSSNPAQTFALNHPLTDAVSPTAVRVPRLGSA